MMECWELRVAGCLLRCAERTGRDRAVGLAVRGFKKNHTPKQAVERPKVEEKEEV